MDSFDGIFLEEVSDEMENNVTPSELGTKVALSCGNASSTSIH
jgi:hypothetical protein